MKTLPERFNAKVDEILPHFWDEMSVPAHLDTYVKIEEHLKPHGEFVEGMAATLIAILKNEDA